MLIFSSVSLCSFCGESFFLYYFFGKVLYCLGQCDTSTQQGTILCAGRKKALANKALSAHTGSNLAEPVLDVLTLECNMKNFSSKVNKPGFFTFSCSGPELQISLISTSLDRKQRSILSLLLSTWMYQQHPGYRDVPCFLLVVENLRAAPSWSCPGECIPSPQKI